MEEVENPEVPEVPETPGLPENRTHGEAPAGGEIPESPDVPKAGIYPTVKNAIFLTLLLLLVQIVLGIFSGIILLSLDLDVFSVGGGIVLGAATVLSFFLLLRMGQTKTKRPFNDVFKFNKVPPRLWFSTVLFGAGLVIVVSEVDNLLNYLFSMPPPFAGAFFGTLANESLVLTLILTAVIAPVTEEMFFRGLILDGLGRNYSAKKAIIVSALLFGIIHLDPRQSLTAFFLGLFLGWVCLKSGSILLSLYLHFFNNLISILSGYFRDVVPIRGFNAGLDGTAVFHPLWFDIAGAAAFAIGLVLLRRAFAAMPRDKAGAVQPPSEDGEIS